MKKTWFAWIHRPLALGLLAALVGLGSGEVLKAWADNAAQAPTFSQDWSNAGLITANDTWTGVPGIIGYNGAGLTGSTGTDPRTITAADDPGTVQVLANQSNVAISNGGVAEFDGITNRVVAMQGSGTANAPYIKLHLSTTGFTSIVLAYNVRDIDNTTDNAVQQVNAQYRIGSSGTWTNITGTYIADATTGPSLATLVTPISVTLPAACENQALVQVRIMTTNAVGNDEFVGIDDISVTGTPSTHTITASAGAGGSISPSGAVVVNDGANQSFTVTANSCFSIADVVVDGVSQGAVSSYTFTNVTANHTIIATFSANGPYSIDASAGAGGSISPSGIASVACAGTQAYSVTADPCFVTSDVVVDGVSQGAVAGYTFSNVQANHTITASFAAASYTIAASAGAGGTISPSGSVVVACAGNQDFTIAPSSACFSISDVVVDGVSQGAIASYTFTNVQANHTISATFAATTFSIDASAGAGGSISPSGSVPVTCGTDQAFSISANSCFSIADVSVDGASQGAISSYTFTNVQANHTIAATFSANGPYAIAASAGAGGTITPTSPVSNPGVSEDFGGSTLPSGWSDFAWGGGGSSVVGGGVLTVDGARANPEPYAGGPGTSLEFTATFSADPFQHAGFGGGNQNPPNEVYNTSPWAMFSTGTTGSTVQARVWDGVNGQQNFDLSPSLLGSAHRYRVDWNASSIDFYVDGSLVHTEGATIGASMRPAFSDFNTGGGVLTVDQVRLSPYIVACGADLGFAIAANNCHSIADVVVDGVSQGAVSSYNFTNVQANHTISASFTASPSFTIDASAGAGGSITPSGSVSVACGGDQTFAIAANSCFAIADVVVDGASQGAVASYSFSNVQANHTISATFNAVSYTIAASAGTGGSITPSGSVVVACGTNQAFQISPDSQCFGIADVVVDGVSQGSIKSYVFTNVQTNHTIAATFMQNGPYTIVASAGTGGSISPSGNVSVACGADQAFTITPDNCFAIADVQVDGGSQGPISSYTFTGVNFGHTISATFGPSAIYTIAASAGAGGSISPSGSVSVACGQDQSFSIAPSSSCFVIADVVVDGASQGAIAGYTFTNVTANHTISATFNAVTYTIDASAGPGGSITPSGSVVVACGADQAFVVTPNSACFAIADLIVDGVSQGAIKTYTFTNVTANHTIAATFSQNGPYTLTVNIVGSGTVAKSPDQPDYACGSVVQLTPTAGAGYHFDSWSGDASGSANPLSVTMDANKTITATFLANIYAWNQTGSASWTVATNWTPSRVTPATDDVLLFNNGATTTATNIPATQTIAQLLISGTTNVTLASTGSVLTINGGSGADFDVASGSTLNATGTGTNTIRINLAAAATGTVGGRINLSGGAHGINALGTNALVFQSGSLITLGTGFSGNPFGIGTGTSALSSVVFQGGSIYAQAAGSNPFGAAQPASVVTFQAGSRFRLDGNVTPSFSGRTYADFEHNTSGGVSGTTTTGGATLTMDNFFVTQGTMNCNMTGVFNLHGSITVNSGATLNFAPASGTPAVTFNGSAPQTITNNGTLTVASNETFEMANASGVSLGSSLSLAGSVRFTTGNVSTGLNTLAIALTGNVTGASQSTGWVNGNLRRNVTGASGTRTFDVGDAIYYTPAVVAMTGLVGNFDMTARTDTPDHLALSSSTINASKSANRWWTLTPVGSPSFTSFAGTFNFNTADLDAGASPSNFHVERFSSGTWTSLAIGTRTATSTQGTGSTAFGEFAVGETSLHTITATAGAGGTISPNGAVLVADGADQGFTITPNACYSIANVVVDGVSQGAVGTYTFVAVTGDHTISASFATTVMATAVVKNTTCDGVPNGAINVSVSGGVPPYTFAWSNGATSEDLVGVPNGDYDLTVTDNGGCSQTTEFSVFVDGFSAITAQVIGGGTISQQGTHHYLCGFDQEFTITPDPGFAIVSVMIDDATDAGPVTSYTFTSVTDNHKIVAVFGQTTAVQDIPKEFGLSSAWPNPTKGDAAFSFAVAKTADVKVSVIDVTGRVVDVIAQGTHEPGRYMVKWGGRGSVAAGMYFIRYDAAGQRFVRRLIVSH